MPTNQVAATSHPSRKFVLSAAGRDHESGGLSFGDEDEFPLTFEWDEVVYASAVPHGSLLVSDAVRLVDRPRVARYGSPKGSSGGRTAPDPSLEGL